MSKRVAIGIDLGTTNSCVGVFMNGSVKIIENDMGHKTTPSQVAFDGSEIHVGVGANDQAMINPKNTVFQAKRLIGRRFDDVQKDIKQYPFEVVDDNGAPKIMVDFNGGRKDWSPEQISSMVLKMVKKDAKRSTECDIQDVVITVPAYFNDSQRQATVDAGKIAGLNVLSTINEPTAAALAFGFERKHFRDQTVLVFDFGGGTFDVSIISIASRKYIVKAVGGDTHLGGADFDERLVNHFCKIAKQKHNKDISNNPYNLFLLRESCEKAKILLSTRTGFKANVNVPNLLNGNHFIEPLTRALFEELCLDLFEKTIEHVKTVLNDASMNKSDIDEVLLVGGSSRIPKIQELLREFFDGKKLNSTVNPDEAVAYGAAVKAALVSGEHTIEEITLEDVVPLSLGISTKKDTTMAVFIKRNSRIPVTVVQNHWTVDSGSGTSCLVKVLEGERLRTSDNNLLGTFEFDVGEQMIEGVVKLTITFEINGNGILCVSGVNRNNNATASLAITLNKGRLTDEQIEKMEQEVKKLSIA